MSSEVMVLMEVCDIRVHKSVETLSATVLRSVS